MATRNLVLTTPGTKLGATALFVANGRTWTVDDAVESAAARGTLEPAIHETLTLIAAEDRADEEGVEPDPESLQKQSEKFRYDHDLISAGETEDWFASRGMSLDDFGEWLYQRLCADVLGSSDTESDPPEDFAERLRIHLWLSGRMDEIERELRHRVASQIELASRGETMNPEAAYDRLRADVITDDGRKRKLAQSQMSLIKVEIDALELDSEEAAREACLCVREDQTTLAEVAKDAGYRDIRDEVWIDALDDTIARRLAGAAAGDIIGPVKVEDHYKVTQLLRRVEPSLDRPDVVKRIDEMLIDEFFDDLCSRHIQSAAPAHTEQ